MRSKKSSANWAVNGKGTKNTQLIKVKKMLAASIALHSQTDDSPGKYRLSTVWYCKNSYLKMCLGGCRQEQINHFHNVNQ